MAEVFLAAWQVAPDVVRPVVIKRLYSHFSDDPSLVRMFLDEARLVCQLDHECIVKTYEVGLIDGHLSIAMEYLEGQTVQQLLRRATERRGIPVPLAAHLAHRALLGLRFAHESRDRHGVSNDIVHRDISPQNIFVTNGGQVKLLDFGVAKARCHEQRTSTGIVKGKFAYVAPEQAAGQKVDARADIWSLGVVLWELLAGRRLFKGEGDAATLNATLHRQIPRLSEVRSEIHQGLSCCVERALQRNPNQRYPSADAMLRDLNRYLDQLEQQPDAHAMGRMMSQLFDEEIRCQQQLVSDLIVQHRSRPPADPGATESAATTSDDTSQSANAATEALVLSLRRDNRRFMTYTLLVVGALLVAVGLLLNSQWSSPRSAANVATPKPSSTTVPMAATAAGPMVAPAAAQPIAVPVALPESGRTALPRPSTALHEPAALAQGSQMRARLEGHSTAHRALHPQKGTKSKTVTRDDAATATAAASAPTAAVEFGYLTIDSSPWSQVISKGRSLGQTPIVKLRLPAGDHVLTLRNSDLGLETQYTVTVVADQTTVKRIGLK